MRKTAAALIAALTALVMVAAGPASAATVAADAAPTRFLRYTEQSFGAYASDGSYYVTDNSPAQVAAFAPGAAGTDAPAKTFTGFSSPSSVTVHPTGGLAALDSNHIVVWDPAQPSGAVVPLRTLTDPALSNGQQVAWAGDGSLWVITYDQKLLRFAPGADGAAAPVNVIAGSNTGLSNALAGLVIAGLPDGSVAAATIGPDPHVYVFGPGQTGNVAPARSIVTTLSSPAWWQYGISADGAGRLYVSTININNDDWGKVLAYGPGASGSAEPAVVFGGPQAGLAGAVGVSVRPDGGFAALNMIVAAGSSQVLGIAFFNPLSFPAPPTPTPSATAPGAVSGLKVAKKGAKRVVSWQPATGATSYAVTITKGKKTVLAKTVPSPKLSVKAAKLPTGKLKVTVTAVNTAGSGPATTKAFKK